MFSKSNSDKQVLQLWYILKKAVTAAKEFFPKPQFQFMHGKVGHERNLWWVMVATRSEGGRED